MKKLFIPENMNREEPFKVPEGYFERLTDQIMSQLPERVEKDYSRTSLWKHIEPWIYMAAMFVGIALMLNLFVKPNRSLSQLNLASSAEIEDFYQYYEEQGLTSIYDEAFLDEIGNVKFLENK
jgi:hypothetical protein